VDPKTAILRVLASEEAGSGCQWLSLQADRQRRTTRRAKRRYGIEIRPGPLSHRREAKIMTK